jgi:hypothetical protein
MTPHVTENFANVYANYTNYFAYFLWIPVGTCEVPRILKPFSVLITDLIHLLLSVYCHVQSDYVHHSVTVTAILIDDVKLSA